MDKKIIRIMLSLIACVTLLFVVVGTQIATGLTSSFWNNAADRVGGEVATSSRNIAVPDNCKLIGPYSELGCRDDLTGSISIVIT
jgi:hypothetical protein